MPERPPRKWFLVSVSDAVWLQCARLQAGWERSLRSAPPRAALRLLPILATARGSPVKKPSASACPVNACRAAPPGQACQRSCGGPFAVITRPSRLKLGVQAPGQRINPSPPLPPLIWSK